MCFTGIRCVPINSTKSTGNTLLSDLTGATASGGPLETHETIVVDVVHLSLIKAPLCDGVLRDNNIIVCNNREVRMREKNP